MISRRAKRENIAHDILKYRILLGHELCSQLLFVHSFTDCDTTSVFYGIGKATAFNQFVKATTFKDIAETFMKYSTSHKEIEEAGGGKASDNTIDITRQTMLSQKVLKAKPFVKPETLPPTRSVLKYHSFRCYYQVMKWCGNDVNAEQWGWINIDNKYYPKTTDKLSAPESLLKIIHCNCTSDCSTMR